MLVCVNCGAVFEVNDLDFDEHDKPKYCPECGHSQFEFEYDEPSRAERRKNSFAKAKHKQNICRHNYGWEWYDNLHQYADNKIHCSCPLCSAKTGRYGPNDWPMPDKKKISEMRDQLFDFQTIGENE